jgi:hypothetical protein
MQRSLNFVPLRFILQDLVADAYAFIAACRLLMVVFRA